MEALFFWYSKPAERIPAAESNWQEWKRVRQDTGESAVKTAAIIAEYNPFHNGHAYQLEEVRKRSGADYLIVLMSGDFVQRGTPAIFDKYVRTETALLNGADLVLELPLFCSTGSAQRFAEGAAAILDGLGIVDELWFGSEEGDLERFAGITDILMEEPKEYKESLKEALRGGLSYPAARSRALSLYLEQVLGSDRIQAQETFLKQPNNILGLEYVMALKKRNSSIRPRTLKRVGSGYHVIQIEGGFSSATAIRNSFQSGDLTAVRSGVPENCFSLYEAVMKKTSDGSLITEKDLSEALRYQLWKESGESLQRILDINEDLANRIIRLRPEFRDFSSFAELLQTRNQTGTGMQRALLHLLLEITEADVWFHQADRDAANEAVNKTILYRRENAGEKIVSRHIIRMLGISRQARNGGLLSGIPKDGPIAVTANPGTHPLKEQYRKELMASSFYQSLLFQKTGLPAVPEYSRKLLVL